MIADPSMFAQAFRARTWPQTRMTSRAIVLERIKRRGARPKQARRKVSAEH